MVHAAKNGQAGGATATRRPPVVRHYGDGVDRVFEEYGKAGDPDVVLLHGGFWRADTNRGYLRPMSRQLAAAGTHVYLPEYRRTAGSPMHSLDDVEDFLGFLAGRGRLVRVMVGHSAGGHLALLHAAAYKTNSPQVVALAPVADLFVHAKDAANGEADIRSWIGASAQERPALWHRLNPAEHLGRRPSRVTVLHGDADEVVPLSVTAGIERTVLPGAGHEDLIDPESRHFRAVLEAVATRL